MVVNDQFSLAYSGYPGSRTTKGCVSQDLLNFGVGKPVELSLMEMGGWVSSLLLTVLMESEIHQGHIFTLKSQRHIQDINQDLKKAMNIKGPSNFLKVDMKIKDAKNIIDREDC
ncbi:hypothetical protein Tco_0064586 [Tanacetum coccineum]